MAHTWQIALATDKTIGLETVQRQEQTSRVIVTVHEGGGTHYMICQEACGHWSCPCHDFGYNCGACNYLEKFTAMRRDGDLNGTHCYASGLL